MLKKLFLISMAVLIASSCSSQQDEVEEENYSQTFAQENSVTALDVINQAIDDINSGEANETLQSLNKELIYLPIEVESLTPLESIDQCTPETDDNSNAAYIGVCPIDDNYQMRVKIYSLTDNFWESGSIEFEVINIPDNMEAYTEIKTTLDNLLDRQIEVLDQLFGFDMSCINYDESEAYCMVLQGNTAAVQYIESIQANAASVYGSEYLANYQTFLFDSESSLWQVRDDGLYINTLSSMNYALLNYETSTIMATQQQDSELIVNLLVSYQDTISPVIHRIVLVDEGNGYRLLTLN